MSKRMSLSARLTLNSGMLVITAGCLPRLNEELVVFHRDVSREALAAFLF